MKKVFFTVFLALCCTMGFAQLSFNVKAGLNLSSYIGDNSDHSKFKPGARVGVGMEYQFTDLVSLQPSLFFSQKGAKYSEGYDGSIIDADADVKINQLYLELPINVQIRFAQPPRDLDYNRENLPWRVQADIAGGGYFYDLAPHQIDLLQDMFGCILEANGYKSNRGGLYPAEDTLSACFQFDNGLVGSGSWCFVAHDSAREDRIEIIGDKGMICFSVFTYEPIGLHTEKGREEICIGNPEHVQQPLIQAVVDHLLGKSICSCDGESATLTNWVMDKILGKI